MKNYQYRILLKRQSLGWLLCLLFLFGCETETNSPQWVTVEHEQYHFSIEYPTKWVVELYGDAGRKGVDDEKLVIQRKGSIFGNPSSPTTFIVIVEVRALNLPSFQDVIYWGDEKIDQNPLVEGVQIKAGYEEFLFQEEEIAGYFGLRRRYTYFNLGGVTREEVYILRENDILIISLYVSEDYFDDFYPDFERIVNSFKTIPSN